jgi:hypothetical protein
MFRLSMSHESGINQNKIPLYSKDHKSSFLSKQTVHLILNLNFQVSVAKTGQLFKGTIGFGYSRETTLFNFSNCFFIRSSDTIVSIVNFLL